MLSKSEETPLKPYDFTTVYDGDSTTRTELAWTSDIALDEEGYPYVAFSVTKDPIRLGETENAEQGGTIIATTTRAGTGTSGISTRLRTLAPGCIRAKMSIPAWSACIPPTQM